MPLLFLLSRIEPIAKTQRIYIGITECKGTTFMGDMQYLSHGSLLSFPTFLSVNAVTSVTSNVDMYITF